MGLDVNIITENLGQAIHNEDLLKYVREGLTSTGLKVVALEAHIPLVRHEPVSGTTFC